MRIAVLGGSGRTGSQVVAAIEAAPDLELVGSFGRANPPRAGSFEGVDAAIDFSLPAGLRAALPHLGAVPLVTGTTGLEPADTAALDAQALRGPVLQAANFSAGVTLLLDLAARAAAALPDCDLEIVEVHHRHKRDAPSGTALALAEAVARARGLDPERAIRNGRGGVVGSRPADEIGIHAVRAGGVVGEHTLWLASETERVQLAHVAHSRAAFAEGALRAARWLIGREPGRYSMTQVLFER